MLSQGHEAFSGFWVVVRWHRSKYRVWDVEESRVRGAPGKVCVCMRGVCVDEEERETTRRHTRPSRRSRVIGQQWSAGLRATPDRR